MPGLSITNYWSLLKLMSIESVMPSNHVILCHPLLLLPSIFPSIRVFSNELTLHTRGPKYWSFSFSIRPSKEHPGLISFRMDWLDLLAVQRTRLWNEAGQRLIEFCQENALVIANTLFQKPEKSSVEEDNPMQGREMGDGAEEKNRGLNQL